MDEVGPILIFVFLGAGLLLVVAWICTTNSSVKPPRAYGYHVDLADLARQAGDIQREQEELNKALESLNGNEKFKQFRARIEARMKQPENNQPS